MSSNKSFLELALEVIRESKEPLSFKDLFDKVVEKSGQTLSADERKRAMSSLYTQLTYDGRLFLTDNKWDLKDRHKFEEYYRDTSELDEGDDEIDDEEEKALQNEESGYMSSYDEQAENADELSDFENKKSSDDEDF